jgi:cation diffusion facilitator CzcD-associated flavoprotein CzcO
VYAIREALKNRLVPTLFEESGSVGGVWRSDNHWDSLTTNSSKDMMAVPEFPFPFETSSEFPTRVSAILAAVKSIEVPFGLSELN